MGAGGRKGTHRVEIGGPIPHHLASAHGPRTDSVPLARLSPGSQTPSSPGDWESEFGVGGRKERVWGDLISPSHTHPGP